MKPAAKALLFSAFIVPGAGHFHLKKFKSGLLFLALTGLSMTTIINHYVQIARRVLEKINAGETGLDIASISQQINAQQALQNPMAVSIAWGLLVAVYLICLADTYRVGKNQPHQASSQIESRID